MADKRSVMRIFDGHNDVLLRLVRKREPDGGVASFLDGDGEGHIDLPRARSGGFAGGLFAVFVPSAEPEADRDQMMRRAGYDIPLPEQTGLALAQAAALEMVALLFRLARASNGALRICRDAGEIRTSMDADAIAAALHLEGAEPIDRDLQMLEVLYAAGLRSLGPVWSRPNIFGHGVPFRFPSTPDTGAGLTEEGEALIKACNELRVMIDLSHITEQGFWDVARLSSAPLVATHSNAHALCPHARNLTDRQLAAIRDTRGLSASTSQPAFCAKTGVWSPILL
jgi:membrane dipeptidase